MAERHFRCESVARTLAVGSALGRALRGGEVLAVNGPLGAGKTHLIKGLAVGLGIEDPGAVNSPTFVLINEIEGRLTLYHIDAYRLPSADRFEALGFTDLLGADSVVAIEWAERVVASLAGIECVRVDLKHRGPTEREIVMANLPPHLYDALATAPGQA